MKRNAVFPPTPAVPAWPEPRRISRTTVRTLATFFSTLLAASLLCVWASDRRDATQSRYQPAEAITVSAPSSARALPTQVLTALPEGTSVSSVTYTAPRLLAGKLLLIDREHALPQNVSSPNTFGILSYSHGRLTCRDTQAVTGEETLKALDELFLAARRDKINVFTIFRGTLSASQQLALQTERFTALAQTLPLEEALVRTQKEIVDPGCSEHQTAYAVDIRICDSWDQLPRVEALSASEQGQWLLDHSWEYGFIWRYTARNPSCDDSEAWHFRYVGKAHAAMMHALSFTLEEYLSFLHAHPAITLTDAKGKPLYSVLCEEVHQDMTVQAPLGATLEDVSLDNLGWGVAAYSWP